MTVYEYDNNQWFFHGFRTPGSFLWWSWPGYREPKVTPLPADRPVVADLVDPNLIGEAPAELSPLIGDGHIGLPGSFKPGSVSFAGTPYQVGDSSLGTIAVRVLNPQYGVDRTAHFPRPIDHWGQFAVESNPTPNWVISSSYLTSSFYDAHIQVYDIATRTYHEGIGFNNGVVASAGVHDENMNTIEGSTTIAGKVPMGGYIWDPDTDQPHSLTLSVAGSDLAAPYWPWLQRRVTLSEEAQARIPDFEVGSPEWVFAESIRNYEIFIGDHGGGSGFRTRALSDASKRGFDWKGWSLNIADLVPCDGLDGP